MLLKGARPGNRDETFRNKNELVGVLIRKYRVDN